MITGNAFAAVRLVRPQGGEPSGNGARTGVPPRVGCLIKVSQYLPRSDLSFSDDIQVKEDEA